MTTMIKEGKTLINESYSQFRESPFFPLFAVMGASTFAYVGGRFLLNFLNGIRIHFWSRIRVINLRDTFGKWAVVTGCTNGIGRAMALELASRGMNIVLIARNPTYLEELSEQLESEYQIETLIIVADFKDISIYDDIKSKLKPIERDLGILINNVGMAPDEPAYYGKVSDSIILDSINTNITSVSLMSKIALQPMVRRQRGVIVNVSSFTGVYATPLLSIYSSTKAFVNHFSRNLALEYGSKGIFVQSLTPLGVKTKLLKTFWDEESENSSLTPSPEEYAYNAINTFCRTHQTSGYWRHSLAQWFARLLPTSLVDHQMYGIMKTSLDNKRQAKAAASGKVNYAHQVKKHA